jgi:nucleoside-diphosphate-sugar epimerase
MKPGGGDRDRADDVVNVWAAAIESPASYEQILNIGSGQRISINQFADIARAAFQRARGLYPVQYHRRTIRPSSVTFEANTTLARSVLCWIPRTLFAKDL